MILVAAFLVLAVVAVGWLVLSRGLLRARYRRQMVVALKSGKTFRGVLKSADRDVLVLVAAELVAVDGVATSADGEVIVFRAEVEFLQRP